MVFTAQTPLPNITFRLVKNARPLNSPSDYTSVQGQLNSHLHGQPARPPIQMV